MLYGHVCEFEDEGEKKYLLMVREFYPFENPDDEADLAPEIRATFTEPGGDRGILYADAIRWANFHNVKIEGLNNTIKYFQPMMMARIAQLERRMAQMAVLLQEKKNAAEQLLPALQKSIAEHDECHARLDDLEIVVQYAQQNGCQHIDEAVKEIHQGGPHGH